MRIVLLSSNNATDISSCQMSYFPINLNVYFLLYHVQIFFPKIRFQLAELEKQKAESKKELRKKEAEQLNMLFKPVEQKISKGKCLCREILNQEFLLRNVHSVMLIFDEYIVQKKERCSFNSPHHIQHSLPVIWWSMSHYINSRN